MNLSTELRKVDVDVVTFGQYMRPTKRHMKVDRYVEPSEFDKWKEVAEDLGFLYVASGPLVRSSYKVGPVLLGYVRGSRCYHRPENFTLRMCSVVKAMKRKPINWRRRTWHQVL